MQTVRAGSINEKGYLAGMTRRGYSESKCILELGANSLDSLDKVVKSENFNSKILYNITRDKISQVDNGNGMLPEAAENMFAMHRENHSNEASRGVSGIGAKPSLSILSGKTHVDIYTRAPNGPHLRISIPWDKIHSTGTYTGMVEICPMTSDEQAAFHKEREENGMLNSGVAHGTSIRFNYRDGLRHLLEGNFLPISNPAALTAPLDRMGIVFGHDDAKMVLNTYDSSPITLQPYNYFALPDSAYYTGKSIAIIEHIRKDDYDRFLLQTEDGYLEIKKDGRGLAKNPEPMTVNRFGYSTVGQFEIVCGLRLDSSVFNPDVPVKYDSGKKNPGHFNETHLGDNEAFLGCYKLVRNNQTIGLIPPPDLSLSSARASGDSYLSHMLVQVEVRFNPVSKQDNHQDIVVGIQENKNQFDGSNVPKQLSRLVAYVKAEKVKKINAYFNELLASNASATDSSVIAPSNAPSVNNSNMTSPLIMSLLTAAVNPNTVTVNQVDSDTESADAHVDSETESDDAQVDSETESEDAHVVSTDANTANKEPVIQSTEENEDIPQIIFGSDLVTRLQAMIDPSASYNHEATNQLLAHLVSQVFPN